MSDEIQTDAVADDKLAKQRAAQKRYRDTHKAKKRTAKPRTKADAAIGVTAHPGEAQRRSEPTREQFRPEVPMETVERITRKSREDRDVFGFEVPNHIRKPGWDYQFHTIKVLNQPEDGSKFRTIRDAGWRPVLTRDMPDMADDGAPPDAPIEMLGQRLYTRPMILTRQAQDEDLKYAQEAQRDRWRAASTGQSAIRGEDGIPQDGRIVKRVPLQFDVEGVAG